MPCAQPADILKRDGIIERVGVAIGAAALEGIARQRISRDTLTGTREATYAWIVPASIHVIQPGGRIVGLSHPGVGIAALTRLAGDIAKGIIAVADDQVALLIRTGDYIAKSIILEVARVVGLGLRVGKVQAGEETSSGAYPERSRRAATYSTA